MNTLTNRRCLVTGGAGFIGSHLVDKLINDENEVLVIDNLYAGKRENVNPNAKLYEFDICDFGKIKDLFKGIDYVFHLAAIPRVPISVEDPIYTSNVNILGTINVFKASVDAGVKRVVFSSSSSVYGNQEILPLVETMRLEPVSPYGLQKLVGEQFAKLFVDLYKLQIVSLRYFNVYGPRIDFNSDYSLVLGKFLRQKKDGESLTVYGDGEQTRGFSYVSDVADANINAAVSENIVGGEVMNISTGSSYSINYLAKLIGGEIKYLPKRLGDVLHTQADISLAKKLIGFDPKISFDEGIKKTIDWFNSNGLVS